LSIVNEWASLPARKPSARWGETPSSRLGARAKQKRDCTQASLRAPGLSLFLRNAAVTTPCNAKQGQTRLARRLARLHQSRFCCGGAGIPSVSTHKRQAKKGLCPSESSSAGTVPFIAVRRSEGSGLRKTGANTARWETRNTSATATPKARQQVPDAFKHPHVSSPNRSLRLGVDFQLIPEKALAIQTSVKNNFVKCTVIFRHIQDETRALGHVSSISGWQRKLCSLTRPIYGQESASTWRNVEAD
jgi:hypothetical protein